MLCTVKFPAGRWLSANRFEDALRESGGPHQFSVTDVVFEIPTGCKVMADSAVHLLSLANQLSITTRRVRIRFEDGESGTMGYLNRMGFFDHLAKEVEVLPGRPSISGAKTFGGMNSELVEIARINRECRDKELPTRLSKAVTAALRARNDTQDVEGAIWTVFAELIDNIFSHSATVIDGYAAMQLYKKGNGLQVVVADSGKGIMDTLRPTLQSQNPKLVGLSDSDLLVEVFRQGISRHGNDRGCGLRGSARKALKYKADLEVRLPTCRVILEPANGCYQAKQNTATCYADLPLIWGTHISFRFFLDNLD